MRASTAVVLLSLALSVCAPAAAQDDESAADADSAESTEGSDQSAEAAGAEGEAAETTAAPTPGSHAWAFGPYFRYSIVPAFMLDLFVDLAPTISDPGFGATATYRGSEDGPSFDMGLGYQSFSFSGPFRVKGGDAGDTEWLESSLGVVHLTGSILWEAKFAEQFAFQYGVGLDVGVVTGELKRTEAYKTASGGWAKCPGARVTDIYCLPPMTGAIGTDPYDKKGEQYNVVEKSVPPIFGLPMLPHLALRYTPVPEFWVRFEAAYTIASFWFGLSAAYSPEL
jgi:hypothetical protein